METGAETSNIEVFRTEQGPLTSSVKDENCLASAHTIDHGMFYSLYSESAVPHNNIYLQSFKFNWIYFKLHV